MSSSTSTKRREYIESLGLDDIDVETVMMKVTDMMSDEGDMREGVASYEYEMGKKAGNKNNFRDPIELAKAVVGKHGQELKSSKDLSPREFESKALIYASKMMKEAGMEKVVMTNLFIATRIDYLRKPQFQLLILLQLLKTQECLEML
jgi:hypothetical protein